MGSQSGFSTVSLGANIKYWFFLPFVLVVVLGVGACIGKKGDFMQDVQHISIYIDRRPNEVYEFASDPRNLPRWAAGLARSEVKREGNEWIVDAPFGKVRVKFAEQNTFGVMDHDVTLESGATVHNPHATHTKRRGQRVPVHTNSPARDVC
jgi:uncharacterized membrane protein